MEENNSNNSSKNYLNNVFGNLGIFSTMNEDKEFEILYERLVEKYTEELEKNRQEVLKEDVKNSTIQIILIVCILGIVYFITTGIKLYKYKFIGISLAILLGICTIIIIVLGKRSELKKYNEKIQSIIMKEIAKSYDENLEYNAEEKMKSDIYSETQFLESTYYYYHSSGSITGIINSNCSMKMAQIDLMSIDGVFSGLVVKVETPRPIYSTIYIRKNDGIKYDSVADECFRIKLNSPEFEERFDLYASDKNAVIQLLTTKTIAVLVGFYNQMKKNFDITIKNNYIYIKFYTDNDFNVSPLYRIVMNNNKHKHKHIEFRSLYKPAMNKYVIYKNYKILNSALELTNKLVEIIDEKF